MIRIEMVWLALGASDLRAGIDMLLAQVLRGFPGEAQAHHAYVFANRRADRLKVRVYDGVGMWLSTRRLQAGGFAWPRDDAGVFELKREQFDWLVAGLPWQRAERSAAATDHGELMRWVRGGHLRRCPWLNICVASRAGGMMAAMLEGTLATTRDASPAEAGGSVLGLREVIERIQAELRFEKTRNAALNFEVARLKRWRLGSSSERLDTPRRPCCSTPSWPTPCSRTSRRNRRASPNPRHRQQSARRLARRCRPTCRASRHHHELEQTHCACGEAFKRIGEEVSEQPDCVAAQFFVLRHIRGKYACACCQRVQAAPMPAQMIDKGIPAPGLLAQVAVAKLDEHLPLYRQTEIYARCGVHIPRSSMARSHVGATS